MIMSERQYVETCGSLTGAGTSGWDSLCRVFTITQVFIATEARLVFNPPNGTFHTATQGLAGAALSFARLLFNAHE